MNIDKYLTELFDNYHLEKTDLGLSNTIYILYANNEKYALRVPSNPVLTNDNIKLERQIQLAVKDYGFDFEEVYYDDNTGIRITKWIDDLLTFDQYVQLDKYSLLFKNLRIFHDLKIETNMSFDLVSKYKDYKSRIKKELIDYNSFNDIIVDYEKMNYSPIISHNDLVKGNILYKDHKCYLIDYEFAAMNHPLFDLASLLSENKIFNRFEREVIYNDYFGRIPTPKEISELSIIEKAQNLLWASWANYMYENYENEEYIIIFNDKIKALNIEK